MVGRQVGLNLNNKFNDKELENLYIKLFDQIQLTIADYNYLGKVDGVEISIFRLNILPILKIPALQKIIRNLPKKITNKVEFKLNFSNKNLPLSVNEAYYGTKLEGENKLNAFNLITNNLSLNISYEDKIFCYNIDNESYFIVISNNEYLPSPSFGRGLNEIEKLSDFNFKHIFHATNGIYITTALDNNIKLLKGLHKKKNIFF
jgi:hypothetical protein